MDEDSHEEGEVEGDYQSFIDNVEDTGQTFTSLFRVIFGILGDFSEIADTYYSRLIVFCPESWQKTMHSLHPIVKDSASLVEIVFVFLLIVLEIVVEVCQVVWKRVKPHRPDILVTAGVGAAIGFFGGFFPLTLSAAEAFGVVGYAQMKLCLTHIQQDLKQAWSLSKSIDKQQQEQAQTQAAVDASTAATSTSTAETTETSAATSDTTPPTTTASTPSTAASTSTTGDFALQKLFAILSAINPDRLFEAFRGIAAGCVSVFVTLKSKNLRIITLGNAISVKLEQLVTPVLDPLVPVSLLKWKPYIFSYGSKLIAISLAWRMSKILAAIHSSWRGGFLCARFVLNYLHHFNYLSRPLRRDLHMDMILGITIAALGLWFQFSTRLTLPFPLNIVLFPFTVMELVLTWIVNRTTSVLYHSTVAATAV